MFQNLFCQSIPAQNIQYDLVSMNYSLESRAPFLDKSVIDLAMNLPLKTKLDKGNSKIVLRNILKNYLPEELINQKKNGIWNTFRKFI